MVSRPVKVGIKPSLPFKGISLLLGNDLAGDKVITDPILMDEPCLDQNPDLIEREIPDLYPSCVVIIIIIIKFVTNVKQYNTTVYDMCDRNKEQNFHPNYYLIPLLTMY